MHMYFLVYSECCDPWGPSKNLNCVCTVQALIDAFIEKNQEWAGDKAMMAIHYTPAACSGGLLM